MLRFGSMTVALDYFLGIVDVRNDDDVHKLSLGGFTTQDVANNSFFYIVWRPGCD